jgi:hypothetical protein
LALLNPTAGANAEQWLFGPPSRISENITLFGNQTIVNQSQSDQPIKWIPSQTTTESKQETEVKETRIIADLDSSKTGHKNENEKDCGDGMTFVPQLGKCKDNDDVDPEDDNDYTNPGKCTNCDGPAAPSIPPREEGEPEQTEEDIAVAGEDKNPPPIGIIKPQEDESD